MIEEYGAELVYVPGDNNFVVDTLSRNDTAAETLEEKEEAFLSDEYFLNRRVFEDSIKCPIDFLVIKEAQDIDSDLNKRLKDGNDKDKFGKKTFGEVKIWTQSMKNGANLSYVPEKLVIDLLKWYHFALIHPGTDLMHNSMRHNYHWKGMATDIAEFVKKCPECQCFKITGKKNNGNLPLSNFDRNKPWDVVHVDMIEPWNINFTQVRGNVTTIFKKEFKALTMVERATSWPEFAVARTFTAEHVSLLFDKDWLCRYL